MPPTKYIPPGHAHFVDAEAARMGVVDHGENHHPIAKAKATRALAMLEHLITAAAVQPDLAVAADMLDGGRDHIAALAIALGSALRMLDHAHTGLGLKTPAWVGLQAFFGTAKIKALKTPPAQADVPPLPAPMKETTGPPITATPNGPPGAETPIPPLGFPDQLDPRDHGAADLFPPPPPVEDET